VPISFPDDSSAFSFANSLFYLSSSVIAFKLLRLSYIALSSASIAILEASSIF